MDLAIPAEERCSFAVGERGCLSEIENKIEIINADIRDKDSMKEYINKIGLWHSIAHDKTIDENFVADLKLKIDKKYSNFVE